MCYNIKHKCGDTMPKKAELIGERFGRLMVLQREQRGKRIYWRCKCDCGKYTSVQTCHLMSGATKSCGCYHIDRIHETLDKHKLTTTPIHNLWKNIRQRCSNQNHPRYNDYGGRGIFVCEEWNEFTNFYKWCIANDYKEGLQIDRIDNNEGYSPGNCRFVKCITNNRNRRISVSVDGLSLRQIADTYSIKYDLVHSRYYLLKNKSKPITIKSIIEYTRQS